MEVDTGASISLINESTYKQPWKTPPELVPTSTRLRTYFGQPLTMLGTIKVTVEYEGQQVIQSLLVVKGGGPSLFGRDCLEVIKLDWKSFTVQHTTATHTLEELLSKHKSLFRVELGKSSNITSAFHLNKQATPWFCNSHPVPYALGGKIEDELNCLQQEGIIEPVPFSEWAAPTVPVMKQDGTVNNRCIAL